MHRRTFLAGAPLALAACGSGEAIWAPDDQIRAAFTPGTQPSSITLYTMLNVGSDTGAHSALMVNASQRLMFDPAGSFKHPSIPERNDVLYGMNPTVEAYYVSYHARETYYVEGLEFIVPADVAEQAMALILTAGPVPKAGCSRSVSSLLQQLPGFTDTWVTWFPEKLHAQLKQRDDARVTVYRENDADDKSQALAELSGAITAAR